MPDFMMLPNDPIHGIRTVNLAPGARPVQVFEHWHPAAKTLYKLGDGRWWATYVHCGPAAPYPWLSSPECLGPNMDCGRRLPCPDHPAAARRIHPMPPYSRAYLQATSAPER